MITSVFVKGYVDRIFKRPLSDRYATVLYNDSFQPIAITKSFFAYLHITAEKADRFEPFCIRKTIFVQALYAIRDIQIDNGVIGAKRIFADTYHRRTVYDRRNLKKRSAMIFLKSGYAVAAVYFTKFQNGSGYFSAIVSYFFCGIMRIFVSDVISDASYRHVERSVLV